MKNPFVVASVLTLWVAPQFVFSDATPSKDAPLHEVASEYARGINLAKFDDVGLQFVLSQIINQSIQSEGRVLVSPASQNQLWADFPFHPSPTQKVEVGQTVYIKSVEKGRPSSIRREVIAHILPPSEGDLYHIARVELTVPSMSSLKNPTRNTAFRAGQPITGRIITGNFRVPLAVEKTGLQVLDGKQGIFIVENKRFVFKPLALGREGDTYIEVLAGVELKTPYAIKNADLIKADALKIKSVHAQ